MTEYELRPLADRIIVEQVDGEAESESGLEIPDSARETKLRGRVVAVGPGRILDDGRQLKPEVLVGDEIVYVRFAGNEVTLGSKKLTIVREDEVLAVLKKKGN